jgi:hypothetical protein
MHNLSLINNARYVNLAYAVRVKRLTLALSILEEMGFYGNDAITALRFVGRGLQ